MITKKEKLTLDLLKQGLSNREIAERLNVKLPTVKMHLSNIFKKKSVKNRTQLLFVESLESHKKLVKALDLLREIETQLSNPSQYKSIVTEQVNIWLKIHKFLTEEE